MADFNQPRPRARDAGVVFGVMLPGRHNAITDVAGVKVGHRTLVQGDAIRTGVTAILPHGDNLFQQKVPAAVFSANGFGKLAGSTQVEELGHLETPIVLTNTFGVAAGIDALVTHTLDQPGNEAVLSVNALVGETNDGRLHDIRGRHVTAEHVLEAIRAARPGTVAEGNVGAGTGTVCFGFKGGVGTSSRTLPETLGGHTVGVLVQANFGGVLHIGGVPVGRRLGRYSFAAELNASPEQPAGPDDRDAGDADGSCMIIVATDAPLDARNLERLAVRAFMGLARTGGIASNGSGDYVIAFSTAYRIAHAPSPPVQTVKLLRNDDMSPLFLASIEASEEAIVNVLFAAETMTGNGGNRIEALPLETVLPWLLQAHTP